VKRPILMSSLVLLVLASLLGLISFGCKGYGQTDPLGASGAGGAGGGGGAGVPTSTPTPVTINLNACSSGNITFTFLNSTGFWDIPSAGCLDPSSISSCTIQLITQMAHPAESCGSVNITAPIKPLSNGGYPNITRFQNGHIEFDLTINPAFPLDPVLLANFINHGKTWPDGTHPMLVNTTGTTHFSVPISLAYAGYITGADCAFGLYAYLATPAPSGSNIGSVSNIFWTNQ